MADFDFSDDDFKGTNSATLDFSEDDFTPKKIGPGTSITALPSGLQAPVQAQRQLAQSGDAGMQAGTEGLEEAVRQAQYALQHPKESLKSLPGGILNTAMAVPMGLGKLAYLGAADLVSKIAGQPEYGGNLAAMGKSPDEPLPVDKFLASVARTTPNVGPELIAAKTLAQGPGIVAAGGVGLPGLAGKLISAGFSADMISKAPQLARDLGTELGKNPGQRDQDRLTTLIADAIQTGVFAPQAGLHASRDTIMRYADKPHYLAEQVAKQLSEADLQPVDTGTGLPQPTGLRPPIAARGLPQPQIQPTAEQVRGGLPTQVQGPDIMQGPQIPPGGLPIKRPSQLAPQVLGEQPPAMAGVALPGELRPPSKIDPLTGQIIGEFRPSGEPMGAATRGLTPPEIAASFTQPIRPDISRVSIENPGTFKDVTVSPKVPGAKGVPYRSLGALEPDVTDPNLPEALKPPPAPPGTPLRTAEEIRLEKLRSKPIPEDYEFPESGRGMVNKIVPQGPEEKTSAEERIKDFTVANAPKNAFSLNVEGGGYAHFEPGEGKRWQVTVYDESGEVVEEDEASHLRTLMKKTHGEHNLDLSSYESPGIEEAPEKPVQELPEYKSTLPDQAREHALKILNKSEALLKKGEAGPAMAQLREIAAKLGIPMEEPPPGPWTFEMRREYQRIATQTMGQIEAKYGKQEGWKYASNEQEAAKVHGDVRPQPGESEGKVPVKEGGGGIQPQTERGIPQPGQAPRKVSLSAAEVLDRPMGSTSHTEIGSMSDTELNKLFDAVDDKGARLVNPHQDAVHYGLKYGPQLVPELQRMLRKSNVDFEAAARAGDQQAMKAAYGRMTWAGGAIEGATKTGPNYEHEMASRKQSFSELRSQEKKTGAYGSEPIHPDATKIMRNNGPIEDLLQVVAKTSTELGELAKNLLHIADKAGLKVKIRRDAQVRTSYYEPFKDQIIMAGLRDHIPVREVMHEIIHALVARKIPSYLTMISGEKYRGQSYMAALDVAMEDPNTPKAVKNLIEVYKRAIDHYAKDNPELMDLVGDPQAVAKARMPYGLGHLDEFVSESFARKSFQALLDEMPGLYGKKTLWQSLVESVRNIIGLPAKASSLLHDALQAGAEVIATERPQGESADWGKKYGDPGFGVGEPFQDWMKQFNRVKDERSKLYEKLQSYPEIDRIVREKIGDREFYALPQDVQRLYRLSQFLRELQSMPEYGAYNKAMLGQSGEGVPRIGPGLKLHADVSEEEPPENKNPLKTFYDKDLKRLGKGVGSVAVAGPKLLVKMFSPESLANPKDVDLLFEAKGDREKFLTQAAAALDSVGNKFAKMPEKDRIGFIDRVKRGEKQPTPELQHAADLIRIWDDKLYEAATKYKPGLNYLENHMRVLWKVIPGSDQAKANMLKAGITPEQIASKRPWRGSQGFLRKATLHDMSEGIALGGVPVTTDPMEMFMLHAQDVTKFVAANAAFEPMKKSGSAQFVQKGSNPPPGFIKLEDSIAKAYFRTPEGLMTSNGEWWVNEGTARMINNYLSRDYIRQGSVAHPEFGVIGRGALALKMATTAIELGMSPFHAVFETFENMGSSIGLGLRKIQAGRGLEGFTDVAKGFLTEPIGVLQALGMKVPRGTTAGLGDIVRKYASNAAEFRKSDPDTYDWFVKNYPHAKTLIDDLFTAGAQIGMNEDYRVRGIKGFQKAIGHSLEYIDTKQFAQKGLAGLGKALMQDNLFGAAWRSIPALNELMLKPLFQTYIPRLKLGTFIKEYSFELEQRQADLAAGKVTRQQIARQTWRFVEDRFGELNFDNLYWNRTLKSSMQLSFRSVTWKLGNIEGFGKAARDTLQQVSKPARYVAGGVLKDFGKSNKFTLNKALKDAAAELGQKWQDEGFTPKMTLPMSWLLGMSVVTGVAGSIISKIFTGKYPWETAKNAGELARDLAFPRIDPADPSQRVSIPTYWKDAVHAVHDPVDYVKSSMSGEIGRLWDTWNNKDFYGVEVYNPDDPLYQKSLDVAKHLVPQPFGLSSYTAARRTGASGVRALAGFSGFTKAPYYMSYTPAELKINELIRSKMPIGSKTREVFERGVNERIAVDSIKRKEMTLNEAIQKKLVLPRRAKEVMKRASLSHLVYGMSSPEITPDEAIKVYQLASDEEKKSLKPIIARKIINSKVTEPARKAELFKILNSAQTSASPPASAPIPATTSGVVR